MPASQPASQQVHTKDVRQNAAVSARVLELIRRLVCYLLRETLLLTEVSLSATTECRAGVTSFHMTVSADEK